MEILVFIPLHAIRFNQINSILGEKRILTRGGGGA